MGAGSRMFELQQPPTFTLSLIVICDAEPLIEDMIRDALQGLFSRATYDSKFTFEVITIAYSANAAAALRKLMQRLSPQMQAICRMIQPCSRGLPLSVVLKSGALQAHGELLLVAPADGSIKMSELMHLEKASLTSGWKTPLVVLGQRRPKLRQNLASKLLALVVGCRDARSPARAYSRTAARSLFLAATPLPFNCRHLANAELLLHGRKLGLPLRTVVVNTVDAACGPVVARHRQLSFFWPLRNLTLALYSALECIREFMLLCRRRIVSYPLAAPSQTFS